MQTTRTISANGIDIFLREQGTGPLVLFCHGWPELSYSWRHQIPVIADAGFRVVAPDMRGRGRPMDTLRNDGITNFYWQYFQEPGVAEAEFERDVDFTMRAIFSSGFSSPVRSLFVEEGQGFLGDAAIAHPLPDWIDLKGKIIIDGAGHWIQQERPYEVNAALIAFLKGVAAQ